MRLPGATRAVRGDLPSTRLETLVDTPADKARATADWRDLLLAALHASKPVRRRSATTAAHPWMSPPG